MFVMRSVGEGGGVGMLDICASCYVTPATALHVPNPKSCNATAAPIPNPPPVAGTRIRKRNARACRKVGSRRIGRDDMRVRGGVGWDTIVGYMSV